MESVTITQPNSEEHEQTGSLAVQNARSATIENNTDRELAGSVVAELNHYIKVIENEFNGSDFEPGPVTLAHRTWKSMVALRDKALGGFIEAKGIWQQKVRKFEFDVEQKRITEARKLEAKAREKAEAERAQQIKEARRLGDSEAVENLKTAPISVQAQAPKTPEVTKAEGLRRSAPMWAWHMVDINRIPREYLIVDEKAVNAIVRRLGDKAIIPGINVYDSRNVEG